jgi:hypothetical protein
MKISQLSGLKQIEGNFLSFWTRFEMRKYIMNLMESLPRRLQAITDGEGKHINYRGTVHPMSPFQGQNKIFKDTVYLT